jgi:hypothetical protein
MPHQSPDLEHTTVPVNEVQTELEAVLRSTAFERSERLQRFLRFICELTLKGEASRINEYLIGSEVFQRGPGYSPNEDSIVRRQALTLRQKLQEYYSAEGRDHSVRIELPVGRYVPIFRRIEIPAPVPVPAAVQAEPEAVRPTERFDYKRYLIPAALVLAGILIGTAVTRITSGAAAPSLGPATLEIWGQWLVSGSSAIICFSNPMTAVIKQFDKPQPEDAAPKRYRFLPEQEAIYRSYFKLPDGGFFYYTPAINQTKIGEAVAGVHLASMLTKAGVTARTAQSRFLSWDELRNDDYILLGHNEANHWLELILKDYPFRLVATSGEKQRGIINVKPASGEESEYKITYSHSDQEMDREYALVSMIPGLTPDHKLVLINGLNAQATQAASEYLTSEASVQELLDRLKAAAPTHKGTWHFQAILRTEVYDKVPTKPTLVTMRVL